MLGVNVNPIFTTTCFIIIEDNLDNLGQLRTMQRHTLLAENKDNFCCALIHD